MFLFEVLLYRERACLSKSAELLFRLQYFVRDENL